MNRKILVVFVAGCITLFTSSIIVFNMIEEKNIDTKVIYSTAKTYVSNLFTDREYVVPEQSVIDVLHYEIRIKLKTEEEKIFGKTLITLINKSNISEKIFLNFHENMKISKLTVNGNDRKFQQDNYHLIIENKETNNDTLMIAAEYDGTPKNLGFSSFSFDQYKGSSVVYTLNEPNYASTWFPCNDIPSDKALADIYITNDSSMTSVSNGILIDEQIDGEYKTAHWKTVYPISTYLIALYSADYEIIQENYESITGSSMPLVYYVFPGEEDDAKRDFAEHGDMLRFFEDTFGEYPFIKEKYGVAEFLWQSGAMEHQTITGIGTNFITGRRMFTDILIHELAHHWWGNAVGPDSWKDIWLNEGFATYSEALYYEKSAGKKALESTMNSKFSEYYNKRLYDTDGSLFSGTIYNKGAWVLHMLRRELGDESFFKILREYFKKYKYKNAATKNFINVCEEVTGKNLNSFFEQWVTVGSEVLDLTYNWKYNIQDDGKYEVVLNITQEQNDFRPYRFPLDVDIIGENENYSESVRISKENSDLVFITNFKPIDIILDKDSWLFATIYSE